MSEDYTPFCALLFTPFLVRDLMTVFLFASSCHDEPLNAPVNQWWGAATTPVVPSSVQSGYSFFSET